MVMTHNHSYTYVLITYEYNFFDVNIDETVGDLVDF